MLRRKMKLLVSVGIVTWTLLAVAQAQDLQQQILAKYGNSRGELDEAGTRRLLHDVHAVRNRDKQNKSTVIAVKARAAEQQKPTPPADLPTLSALFAGPDCLPSQKALFVRGDPLDNFHYLVDPSTAPDAKGASVSYTDNRITGTQNATINGRVSYLVVGLQCQQQAGVDPNKPYIGSVGVAPFISSNGTWMEPPGKTVSNSAVKGGMDFQASLYTLENSLVPPFITRQYFYLSPYYQTDYKGLARIEGATLAWEPVAPLLLLDSGPVTPYFSFFWQFRAEADLVSVDNRGLTNLVNKNYAWLGETSRANLALFPITSAVNWPEWLGGRFSLIGTAQYYYDANGGGEAKYYSATLQYKLGQCKKDETKKSDLPCTIQGASSVSFEYDWGTDKDTLVNTKQYLVKLTYAY